MNSQTAEPIIDRQLSPSDEGDLPPRILVVEDDQLAARSLMRLLSRHGYHVSTAHDAAKARTTLASSAFDLVLVDVRMPGESGLDLAEHVLAEHPDLATIMVTAADDRAVAERALDTGAYGYVIKPFKINEMLINVSNALRRRKLEIENRRHREQLEEQVDKRTRHLWSTVTELEIAHRDLARSSEDTLNRLARAAEYRDDETGQHVQRMSRYCHLLASKISPDTEWSDLIRLASLMHDVGKIGIPDHILLKPGKLTPAEFAVMKTHTTIGAEILSGSDAPLLGLARSIALTHHERFDGTGYPNSLKGDGIPLEGRIATVADVFDALTTNRIYRPAFEIPTAIRLMREARGQQFDPTLLDVFLDNIDLALHIHKEDGDRKHDPAA